MERPITLLFNFCRHFHLGQCGLNTMSALTFVDAVVDESEYRHKTALGPPLLAVLILGHSVCRLTRDVNKCIIQNVMLPFKYGIRARMLLAYKH